MGSPPTILWETNYFPEMSVNILGERPLVPGKAVPCLYHSCAKTSESQGGACILFVFGVSAWTSQCLTHNRYSVRGEMSLVSVGHETETMELAFAQGTGMFLELWPRLLKMIVRWIYFREQ